MGSAEIQELSSSTELLLAIWHALRHWIPHCIFGSVESPRTAVGQLFLDYRGRPSGLPRDDSWWEALGTSPLQSVSLLWLSWSSPGTDNVLLRRYGEHLSTSLFSLLTQISFCPEISCPLCLFKNPGVCVGPPCSLQFSTDSGSTLYPLMSCCKQGTIALSFHQQILDDFILKESESHSVMSDSLQPHGLVHGIL